MRSIMLGRCVAQASLVLTILLGAASARAQCTITGPVSLCGGSGDLCGPEGPYEYEWKGPSGSLIGDQRCITVTTPGTYQLRTFDFINVLWAGPCTHTVVPGGTSSCTITGPSSGCAGSPIELCAVDGAAEYRWTGPNEFYAATRCVQVRAAGIYQAQTRNAPDDCWSNPCEAAVTFERCDERKNCPIAPWEWLRDCRNCRSEHRLFDPKAFAAIGACVDARSASLNWKDERSFCRTLESRRDLRDRARRQVASVFANICAHDLRLDPNLGPSRGLDPATVLSLDGFSGTIATWLAGADQRLGQLERCSSHARKTKDGYWSIIRDGWRINHGLGMGPVCSQRKAASSEWEPGVAGAMTEDESLPEEMRDPDETLELETLNNPATGPARVAYVVPSGQEGDSFLGVYDLAGRLVRELDRGVRAPGRHELAWDGRDAEGHAVRNGAYFLTGYVGSRRIESRLILLR